MKATFVPLVSLAIIVFTLGRAGVAAAQPPEEEKVQVVQLKYGNAKAMAEEVNQMIGTRAIADERTNQVIIRGNKGMLGQAIDLIKQIDIVASPRPQVEQELRTPTTDRRAWDVNTELLNVCNPPVDALVVRVGAFGANFSNLKGYVKLVHVATGKVLGIRNDNTKVLTNATALQGQAVLAKDEPNDARQWRIERDEDGLLRIINRKSGQVLDLRKSIETEGGEIIQWPEWQPKFDNQRFEWVGTARSAD